ncbi:MAG: T9SS type A sorting domain-containing protein [Bacteroidia bacterium]
MRKLNQFFVLLAFVCININVLKAQTTILDETLLTQESFGTFTPFSVTGTQNWYFSAQYGAVCSGFTGGQSFANEDWLISPVINLENADNVKLSFNHTRGNAAVMNSGVNEGWYKAFATANYTGNPATTTWVELTGLNQNITTAWQYVSSGELTVPESAKSQSSRIAFRYMSSATASATWEIKNVKVTGDVEGTNPGSGGSFKITNWNTEWLGCTQFGPDDETRQLNNVVTVIRSMNSDIYCLQEVTNSPSTPTVDNLVSLLGSTEWGGAVVDVTEDCTQRQVLIYKKSRVQFVSGSEMSSGSSSQGNSYSFNWSSGRFPAAFTVNLLSGSNVVPVTLVNIHAKAEDDNASSYTRRLGGSIALKATLDGSSYSSRNLILIGDYNDYLVGTTSEACNCTDSPYKNFMDDAIRYTPLTSNFSNRIIENIIVSNELAGNYVAGSVLRQTNMLQLIPGFYNNTSNHLPVSATFQFATMGEPNVKANDIWTMYPNPVKDVLNINVSGLVNDTAVQVYDIAGRQVLAGDLSANTFNVSALPSGMYILKLDGKSGKFIKE